MPIVSDCVSAAVEWVYAYVWPVMILLQVGSLVYVVARMFGWLK